MTHSQPRRLSAGGIVAAYALVAGPWMAFAHDVHALLGITALGHEDFELLNALLFVAITATLLYVLMRRRDLAQRSSEERMRAILDNSSSCLVSVKDAHGRYVLVNRKYELVFGLKREQVVGQTDARLYPDAIAAALQAHDTQVLSSGSAEEFEEVIPLAEGERTFLSVKFPLRKPGGETYAVCAIATDISERKRMEDALRKSEERYRDVVEASSDWIWETDEHHRFTYISERLYELTGISPSQALGRTRWELVAEDNNSPQWVHYRELLKEHLPFRDFVYHPALADEHGRAHFVKISGRPMYSPEGQFTGYRGTGTDITEQVEAEAALRESQRTLTTLMGNLPGMAYRSSAPLDHSLEFVSGGVVKLTGYQAQDLVGDRRLAYAELIHPQDRARVRAEMDAALKSRQPFHLSYRIRTAIGEERWVWEQGCGVFAPLGQVSAVEGLVLDITERKQAERALEESEAHNRLIVDTALDAVITIDATGVVTGWNPQAEVVFGFRRGDAIGQHLSQTIIPRAHREAHERGMVHYQQTGEGPVLGRRFETVALHRDGREFPVEIAIVPLESERGVSFSAFVRDITGRREAEERLRRSEEQLRLTLENAPIGIITADLGGRLLSVNPAYCNILGYTPEELLQMTVLDVTQPDERDETIEHFRSLVRGEASSCDMEKHYQRKDGTGVNVRARAGLVRDAEGEPLLIVAEVEDITERRRAAQEMQRMRGYLKNIIDSMPSVLVGVDTEGRVTEWNTGAERATGVNAARALGRGFGELFPQLESQLEKVAEAIGKRAPVRSERLVVEREGESRFADVVVYPLLADEAMGAVIRVDDITSRVRIEQMMVQTEKMVSVGGLAAGMAHEINNPLSATLQGCQNILRRLSPELAANREVAAELGLDLEVVRRYLEQREVLHFLAGIQEAAGRATRIVADMLGFSRRSDAEFVPVALDEMLETVLRLAASDYDLKKKYDFKQIEIIREYAPGLEPVECDRTEIEQVLLNLVKNAAQAMAGREGVQRITLRTRAEGRYARIDVLDSGPGMDERTRRRVFEPFFTTKPVGVGTGLGLSVSYFIITEQHRGTIGVASRPGQGACFTIRLPWRRSPTK